MHRKGIHVETLIKWGLGLLIFAVIAAFFIPGVRTAAENLFGFLNRNYGNGITEGKVLHVRLDPSRNKVSEFHLTNLNNGQHISENVKGDERAAFYLDTSPKEYDQNCIILTTYEKDGGAVDLGYIYYVSPGSTVQDGCTNLDSCLTIKESGCNSTAGAAFNGEQVTKCTCYCDVDNAQRTPLCPKPAGLLGYGSEYPCANKFGYVTPSTLIGRLPNCPPWWTLTSPAPFCDARQEVLNKDFEDFANTKDACSDSSLCNLLVANNDGKHAYQVKYGLICDANGKWQVCTEQREKNSDSVTVGSTTLTCKLDNNFFKWE
jgi:hypothetical protein